MTEYILVPKEPTEAMLKAAVWALDKARERDGKLQDSRPYTPQEKHAIRYRAMLAAVCTAPDETNPCGELQAREAKA